MVFQGRLLLLLCVSLGTCATIGHYHTQSAEEEAAAAAAAVTDASVDTAKEDVAAAGDQVRAATNTDVENPAAADPVVDVPVRDVVTAEEPGTGGPVTEALDRGASNQGQTSSEEWNEIRAVKVNQPPDRSLAHEDDSSWSLNSIRNSFQTVHGYFDSLVELVGGHNGVCQYRCKYGTYCTVRTPLTPLFRTSLSEMFLTSSCSVTK